MDNKEGISILKTIHAVYPNFLRGSEQDVKSKTEVWLRFLKEMDYERTAAKLDKYIIANEYPPSITDVRPAVQNLDDMTDFENLGDLLGVDNE